MTKVPVIYVDENKKRKGQDQEFLSQGQITNFDQYKVAEFY
jgi:hypothetical protein